MKNNATTKVISTFLIILWIYAAGSKLLVFNNFAPQRTRQPLPTWSVPILQWLIPTIELIVIALLISTKTLAQGFKRSIFLLATFTLYVGFELAYIYHKPPCSWRGILNGAAWGEHLVFNLLFALLSIAGWFLVRSIEQIEIKEREYLETNILK